MELRRTVLGGLFGLVALNVITAFGAVGLLVRMSPVIGNIVSENVQSLEAAEKMLAALAQPENHELAPEARAQFDAALRAAWENVTEAEERPVLSRIEVAKGPALAGDAESRSEVILALRQLSELNRQAMRAADEEARRQGNAGAWFAVVVATLSVVASAFLGRRLTRRLIEPLSQLYRVLEAFRTGQRHRRCTSVDVPAEFRMIFDSVNSLLDDRHVR